jgi:hypothetical protein
MSQKGLAVFRKKLGDPGTVGTVIARPAGSHVPQGCFCIQIEGRKSPDVYSEAFWEIDP